MARTLSLSETLHQHSLAARSRWCNNHSYGERELPVVLPRLQEVAVMSGLAAAERLGADYPFAFDELAADQVSVPICMPCRGFCRLHWLRYIFRLCSVQKKAFHGLRTNGL